MDRPIYNNCDELPIYYFYKILDDKNVGFLYRDYMPNEKITTLEEVALQKAFSEIIYEYSELTFNRRILNKFNAEVKILGMEFRYDNSVKVLNLYKINQDFDVLEILNKLGFNINRNRNIENQVNMVIKSLKGLKNKIKIEKANYLKINKPKDEIKSNLEDQATSLEISLKIGYRLDTKVISVTKWISLNKASEKMIKQHGN